MGFWKSTLENMVNPSNFWKNRNVLITGHTGFKGGWLALYLNTLGAKLFGYSLEPDSSNSFYTVNSLQNIFVKSVFGDIRDSKNFEKVLQDSQPSIIFHLAAQSLVYKSFENPFETLEINILGTVNLFESLRKRVIQPDVIINVTSDKCYLNSGAQKYFKEDDNLGGSDIYSSSKACSEIITSAYRDSFFLDSDIKVATARAGNVIGGGDWSPHRLLPDLMKAAFKHEVAGLRNPESTRPWQHVLDPIRGYILLAEKVFDGGTEFQSAWNFGPEEGEIWSAEKLTKYIKRKLPQLNYEFHPTNDMKEKASLMLDSSKSNKLLGWFPHIDTETALDLTIKWYGAWNSNEDMRMVSQSQIDKYPI